MVGAKIERTARDNGAAASSGSIAHFRRQHTFQLHRMVCCYREVISGSLSRCSPPRYKSPSGQNVNQRIVRCAGELPRSYRV